jgi:hypothetical protein
MMNGKTGLCKDCRKAFNRYITLDHVYCGHNQVLVLRRIYGIVDYVPVQSTDEAMEIMRDINQLDQPVAASA